MKTAAFQAATAVLFALAAWSCDGARPAAVETGGGELRFVIRSDPKTFDPHQVSDEASEVVQYLTGGVLVRINRSTVKAEPALAKSWRILEKGRAIEFHLREGVRFSDGTPFTAEDVAYTVRRFSDPNLRCPFVETFTPAGGRIEVNVRSRYVLVVRLPGVTPGLAELWDQVPIVSASSPHKLEATLGPFHVAEYKAGARILLRRNPYYWRRDKSGRQLPYLDRVSLDIVANRETEMLRFRRGELHLINGLDPEAFERIESAMKAAARDAGPGLDSEQLWFNQAPAAPLAPYKKAWFQSTEFRRAISEAINREDLCRLAYRGRARPAVGAISPANRAWFNPRLQCPLYAPERALDRLERAGFRLSGGALFDPQGRRVEFSIMTNAGNKPRERMAALIQADMAKLGIKVNIDLMDFPALIERITRTSRYEACLLGLNLDIDPNMQMNIWLSSAPNHQWNPNQKSPATPWEAEIDRLMRRQASTTDYAVRKAAFDRVQEIVLEQQPFIYLLNKDVLTAISPALANAQPTAIRPQTFWNVDTLAIKPAPGR
jgi:peptide/nickel transport system substrate-binding protein